MMTCRFSSQLRKFKLMLAPPKLILDIKDEPGLLWEGEVRLKTEEGSEEIKVPVQIFHKDDSKNGCRLFDWAPHGKLYLETYR